MRARFNELIPLAVTFACGFILSGAISQVMEPVYLFFNGVLFILIATYAYFTWYRPYRRKKLREQKKR